MTDTTLAVPTQKQWLNWRRKGIGGSDIASIVGLSPWGSAYSVWADKVGLIPDTDDTNELFEFGHRAERMVGPWFEDRTGLKVSDEQKMCEHPIWPFFRATLDGLVWPSDDKSIHDPLGALEIKTTGPGREWPSIPEHYQCQAQWQMLVADLPAVHFAVLHGRLFRTYKLDRNEADISFLTDQAERFWKEHVVTGTPPAVDGSEATSDTLDALYGCVSDDIVELDDIAAVIQGLRETKAELARLEEEKLLAENLIKQTLGEAQTGIVRGIQAVTWKRQTTARLDQEKLEAEHPDIYKACKRETVGRRFFVKPVTA